MFDPFILEALGRLDQWLLHVCDEEERRAKLLAGPGGRGWEGVRNLVAPSVSDLIYSADRRPPELLPETDHALHRLGRGLGLDHVERELLLVLLAPTIEPRYSALYAVLQDDLKEQHVTERVLLSVLGRTPDRRRTVVRTLASGGRLRETGAVVLDLAVGAPLRRPVSLAEEVRESLLGVSELHVAGSVRSGVYPGTGGDETAPSACPALLLLHGSGDRLQAALERIPESRKQLLVTAPADVTKARAVCAAAWRLGIAHGMRPLLDLSHLDSRDALSVALGIRELVTSYGGHSWFLCRDPLPLAIPQDEVTPPPWAVRRAAWVAEADAQSKSLSSDDAGWLASKYRLTSGQISEVFAQSASDGVAHWDLAARRITRTTIRHAVEVPTTRDFSDLVLRDTTRQALQRLVYYVEQRDTVAQSYGLERRFRLERGPIALFSGRSGTGKTVAAEAVANALKRQLFAVDLSRLVSKYIGETEKHIDEVLSQGQSAGAVLFFDEADALFSNRTDVSSSNDRFANMEVGYLLQRIERHDGVVILATNLRHSIDEAFLRRFQFRVEFPLPQPDERYLIWNLMLPEELCTSGKLDLKAIAHTHRLAGGDIRNAALRAIFLAKEERQELSNALVERAIALELLELGRLSRRKTESDAVAAGADRGQLLRAYVEALQSSLEEYLRVQFMKEIFVLHGSPTKENLAGKRPAVSVALFRVAGRKGPGGLRMGFVVSAWSHTAEEEHELLGAIYEALSRLQIEQVCDRVCQSRIQESFDFDLLHRFWSSHGHPVRASVVLEAEIH